VRIGLLSYEMKSGTKWKSTAGCEESANDRDCRFELSDFGSPTAIDIGRKGEDLAKQDHRQQTSLVSVA
jgi:hypothetical protein